GDKRVIVTDNGEGMSRAIMQLALQFGGSTRFNARRGTGRYGMGLPNSSLSQARRVDVYSWTNPHRIWTTYLDVDEIATGTLEGVPEPTRFKPTRPEEYPSSPSGTILLLSKCDRLDYRTIRALVRHLQADLGRTFRQQLYAGKDLRINGEIVKPIDPLFLKEGNNRTGAEPYGPPLTYEISSSGGLPSPVVVRFSLLPIEQWHGLSNEEKHHYGISRNAGVSIVRAGREVDYGWYFMGSKRKENYDDWWRCEVSFNPDLDELFGITHTKQKINPTETLNEILSPDLGRVARELNGIVRKRYLGTRTIEKKFHSVAVAQARDHLMEPLDGAQSSVRRSVRPHMALSRLGYEINEQVLEDVSFYLPSLGRNTLKLVLNQDHTFYQKVYQPLIKAEHLEPARMLEHLQLLLLAAARAECSMKSQEERTVAERLRHGWSNALTAFLD
ncbi:MAG: ATP-binding protein, partial [Deltaproteobacteria bacterium]|nr:ATP-binding protein [Deltaproteobacteria bacterium]